MSEVEANAQERPCLNCGAVLSSRYCAECGQRSDTSRLRLANWAGESLATATNLEAGLLNTIIGLTLRPGKTARRYVEGQRIRFTSPLKYSLLGAGLWLLAFSIAIETPEDDGSLTALFLRYGQLINLAAIPLIAIGYLAAFLGSKYTYAEELCLAAYIAGHTFMWRALLALLNLTEAPVALISQIDSVLFFAYSSWATWSFHSGRVRWIALRVLAGLIGIVVVTVIVSLPLRMLAQMNSAG